jgi:hypothetical protein
VELGIGFAYLVSELGRRFLPRENSEEQNSAEECGANQ